MSSERTPPWRDRIDRATAAPLSRRISAPYRASTGAWAQRKASSERKPYKTLPDSWKQAAEDLPIPLWARGAVLWLLDVPRWIYIVGGAVVLVGGLGLLITIASLYSYLSKPVAIPDPT